MLPLDFYARELVLRARALASRILIWLASALLAGAKALQGRG